MHTNTYESMEKTSVHNHKNHQELLNFQVLVFLFCFFETQNLEVLGKKVDAMSLQDDVWIEYFFL